METKQPKLNVYLLLFSVLSIATVTLRSIASFLYLGRYGYYSGNLSAIANYTVILGSLFLLSYAILYRNGASKHASFGGPLTYIPSAPLAITLFWIGVSFLRKKADAQIGKLLLPLIGALAILGALYFLFAVLYEYKVCDLRAVFCMACTLYLILYAGYLYFDAKLPINAETKICDQVAYIAAAIFFLFETRISLGREHWHLYTACGFVASLVCAYSSIPSLLLYIFEGRVISNSIEETLVTLFLFAFILCRTVLSLLLKEERATPLMALLHQDAQSLADAVAAHGPLPFEPKPITEEDATEEGSDASADAEAAEESDNAEDREDSEFFGESENGDDEELRKNDAQAQEENA